ncbi:MAG: YdcF family protein [Armatimonadota bacterium]
MYRFILTSWTAVARGAACFLGGFSLLNLLGGLVLPGFDANLWWIDFRPLPAPAAGVFLAIAAVLLIGFACRPRMGPRRRWFTGIAVAILGLITTLNVLGYYRLRASGQLHAEFPVPVSLVITCALWLMLPVLLVREPATGKLHRVIIVFTVLAWLIGFPLLQVFGFGTTDYRRPADAIVVFGARAYANGYPSPSLAHRVRTACELYHAGLAPLLIFSGGPGDGPVHETESMRRMAHYLHVPDSAILVDTKGVDTRATVRNTSAIFRQRHITRIIAVSHFYHLPRIKLTYQRAGCHVYTVPARDHIPIVQTPYSVLREVAALWVYYLTPSSRAGL